MYSILIVDDEKNIRDGIVRNCRWHDCRIDRVEQACNGLEALSVMEQKRPDIVITDVKMPVMTGLEFLKIASEKYPQTQYVVLSGYEEFEFARTALKYNAQEYILKPCSVEEIHTVVQRLVAQIDQQRAQAQREDKYRVLEAHMRRQAVCRYILGGAGEDARWNLDLGAFLTAELRLLLLRPDQAEERGQLHTVRALVQKGLGGQRHIFTCETAGDCILVCMEYNPYIQLHPQLLYLRELCREQCGTPLTIVVGEKTSYSLVQASYRNLLECMSISFYRGNDSIITTYDRPKQEVWLRQNALQTEELLLAIRSGNREELLVILEGFYETLNHVTYSVPQIRACVVEAYLAVSKLLDRNAYPQVFTGINKIMESSSLEAIMQTLRRIAVQALDEIAGQQERRPKALIRQMDAIIEEHLTDENLSLSAIARDMLFVNAAYLGKLFAAEKSQKFSEYVSNKRIARAKTLLLQSEDVRIKDISLQSGFGYNTQYFSHVFKNATGYTPKEYRKKFGGRT